MKNIGVVITHYKTMDKTIECIDSFLKCDVEDYDVRYVIVDNGSNDGSGEKMKSIYENKKMVHILSLENNIAFSKAMGG